MTGRELIMFILQNKLEDVQLCEEGKIPGYATIEETALKFDVGTETINIWINERWLPSITIGDKKYIPVDAIPKVGLYNFELYIDSLEGKGFKYE